MSQQPAGDSRPTVAAAVITKNEERNIRDCLATLQWADEVLVLDSYSADDTVALARAHTSQVFQRRFDDFARQRNAALGLLQSDWVLFVDADERVSPVLATEVREAAANAENDWQSGRQRPIAGFWAPRQNYILGRWIRHGGWYPDCQLRLLKVGKAHYDEARKVHEVVVLEGEANYLQNPFVHYNYQRLSQLIAKQAAYAPLDALSMEERGLRARLHSPVLQPLREFRRRYITLQGYRDGLHGLLLATVVSIYSGVAFAELWRRQRRRAAGNATK